MFAVKMLGGLTISMDDRRLRADLGASGRLLAAYLFEFPGRTHRRERLAHLFWKDLDAEHSRAALNTALWRLRKLLALEAASKEGSNLCSGGSEVVLEPATWLTVDTHCFDQAARMALQPHVAAEIACDTQALEKAADAYAGSFLDGDESDWIIAERERLHSTYIRCLTELLRAYARSKRYESAISIARRILTVDPFRESVQRGLAVLLALNGQRAQAIIELRRWSKALRDEIGIDPMPETSALEQALISRDLSRNLPIFKRIYVEESPSS